jgi:hypothetical protein
MLGVPQQRLQGEFDGHVECGTRRGGMAQMLSPDSILPRRSGAATIVRDSKGERRESPTPNRVHRDDEGSSVVLTINADLQEMRRKKPLAGRTSREWAPTGGDYRHLDPHDGENLAMGEIAPPTSVFVRPSATAANGAV